MSWVPNPLVCCKKRGKEKAKATARSSLSAEMNMISVIQQQRFFAAAFKQLLTEEEQFVLKQKTLFETVESD